MFGYYTVDFAHQLDDFVDKMEELFQVLDQVDLNDYDGHGMEFNMSTVCTDGKLDVGINYKNSDGTTFNIEHSGDNLSDIVDECLADAIAAMFDVKTDEKEQVDDKARIAELESRIAELEADLQVARARNEKHVNTQRKMQQDHDDSFKPHRTWKGIFGV